MGSARERLLARYLEAAGTIADAAAPSLDEGHEGDSHASDGQDEAGVDAQGMAMEGLLRRQAALLVRIHAATMGAGGGGTESGTGGGTAEADARGIDDELLRRRLDDLASAATAKFYAYRYDGVPRRWRCLYTDALVLATHRLVLRALAPPRGRLGAKALDYVVASLDRALITTGGAGRLGPRWIDDTLRALEALAADEPPREPPAKRRRTAASRRAFPAREPYGRPPLAPLRTCPRHRGWSIARFEDYMRADAGNPRPVVFTDLMADWPALTDRPWRDPDYLLARTFGGRRLVPVEVGRSYVDDGWGQELVPFARFLADYVDVDADAAPPPVGYLAQHDLFRQVPALRSDVAVPDLCWAAVPPHPSDPAQDQPPVAAPQLNAWLGPARTITPLHTDGYHNLLCQVVGAKYVRLYPPRAAAAMRPRGPERGVDMSNTSQLDVGVLEGWDEPPPGADDEALRRARDRLAGVDYSECILGPGDALLIPIGWWHYVRSLSISFSVSFWWN